MAFQTRHGRQGGRRLVRRLSGGAGKRPHHMRADFVQTAARLAADVSQQIERRRPAEASGSHHEADRLADRLACHRLACQQGRALFGCPGSVRQAFVPDHPPARDRLAIVR